MVRVSGGIGGLKGLELGLLKDRVTQRVRVTQGLMVTQKVRVSVRFRM